MNNRDENQSSAMAESEAELQDCLQQLGAKRVEATLLASLIQHGSMGTQEIVKQTGLRQPEVSVGMRLLRERAWVDAETVPREGKGRPMHRYKISSDSKSIRQHYLGKGRSSIESFERAMEVLEKNLG